MNNCTLSNNCSISLNETSPMAEVVSSSTSSEDWTRLIILQLVSVTILALGWAVTHFLTLQRQTKSQQLAISTPYLIEAYKTIISIVPNKILGDDDIVKLEAAFDDIILFGDNAEASYCIKFLKDSSKALTSDDLNNNVGPLLSILRNSLRKKLKIDKPDTLSPLPVFRFARFHDEGAFNTCLLKLDTTRLARARAMPPEPEDEESPGAGAAAPQRTPSSTHGGVTSTPG